jgi:DNA helicase-2/ATP-dependent DNA helicase PcrA
MKKSLNLLKLVATGLTVIPIIRGSVRNLSPKLLQKERLISYYQDKNLAKIKDKFQAQRFVDKKFFSEQSDFLKDLNENQKKAVTCPDKRICVIAGPGCGKTKTMTSRAVHLLKNDLVKPDQILLVTFSKNSAEEMESRIRDYLRKEEELLPNNIGTIHSFCYRFLQENSHSFGAEDVDVCIREHQEDLVQEILKEMNSALCFNSREIKDIVKEIAYCKSSGINDFYLMNDFHRKVAFKYQEYSEKNHLLDFEDLLLNTLKILQENQKVREKYQERFSHILVDEFQDVNEIQ